MMVEVDPQVAVAVVVMMKMLLMMVIAKEVDQYCFISLLLLVLLVHLPGGLVARLLLLGSL
mgnify:CR=1 FL=1